jgi:hypothetical protein
MSNHTQVRDQFRKNELSITPGGSTVTVFYTTGKSIAYDKVKNAHSYCNAILKKTNSVDILKIEVDGVLYYQNQNK